MTYISESLLADLITIGCNGAVVGLAVMAISYCISWLVCTAIKLIHKCIM